MKPLLFLLLGMVVSAPALAQHGGHATPAPTPAPPDTHVGHNMPATPAQPADPPADPHAGHATPAPRAAPNSASPAADPHAGHNVASTPQPPPAQATPDPHAGHAMPPPAAPTMPGHDMDGMPRSGPMAGHDMTSTAEVDDPPVTPPSPAAHGGPDHAADTVFPAARMTDARDVLRNEHGRIRAYRVLVEQLEARIRNGDDGYAWDAQAWYGGALDRLWIKTEGEGRFGSGPDEAELQALWSHALDPWFNIQAGVRYDFRPAPERAYLVLGVEGLAPYWFEVDGAVFLSEKGDLSARFEAEFDQRITQRLILQPRIDLDLALQDVPEIEVGSGLSTAEAGLRLRYEFAPEFAPYVGVHYERAFGDTAQFRRAAGEDIGGWSLLVGVRTGF